MLDFSAMNGWLLIMAWLLANAALILVYRRDLARLWREPVLRHPVLIVESDDWGAGPLTQARALRDLKAVLVKHRDAQGRPPVFCLALILAVPDGPAIRVSGAYHRLTLADEPFQDILAALREGEKAGVFAFHLHGLEHYWPDALMASDDRTVRAWRESDAIGMTEDLPSPLQSRWTHAVKLPSLPLSEYQIDAAVADETALFRQVIGQAAQVVVPPTFVWTRAVETAWARHGIRYVVTPGWRYPYRGGQGLPEGEEGPFVSGQSGVDVHYLVRTDYFEPKRGRDATHALAALDRSVRQGRACMLENHRDNFLAGEATRAISLVEVEHLYARALSTYPGLHFLTTRELGDILAARPTEWVETRVGPRFGAFVMRLLELPRFWKLARLSGMSWCLRLLARWTTTTHAASRPLSAG